MDKQHNKVAFRPSDFKFLAAISGRREWVSKRLWLRRWVGIGLLCLPLALSAAIPSTIDGFPLQINSSLAFDPDWNATEKSPFVEKGSYFEIPVKIGTAKSIQFPKTLDARTPIVINMPGTNVKQYLVSKDTYKAEVAGKYLVYKGERNSILCP